MKPSSWQTSSATMQSAMRRVVVIKQKQRSVARKTLLAALPSNDKGVLVAVKSGFAFTFGFINAVLYLDTKRFATMMSGNTMLLAVQTRNWMSQEMMFSATLIILYVCGGAMYDALSLIVEDDMRLVKFVLIPMIVFCGIFSDVIQFVLGSVYFASPLAFLTGIVTSYLSNHPDGIVTNLVTGHMKVLPKALIKWLFKGDSSGMERGLTSAVIITVYFVGCLLGALVADTVSVSYSEGHFTPIFSVISVVFGVLCYLHNTLCEKFCSNYELESQLIKMARATMIQNRCAARNTDINDLKRMMTAAVNMDEDIGNDGVVDGISSDGEESVDTQDKGITTGGGATNPEDRVDTFNQEGNQEGDRPRALLHSILCKSNTTRDQILAAQ